jgi:hypothetical protein
MSGSPFGILEFFGGQESSTQQVEATNKSTDMQLTAARENNQLIRDMYNQGREDTAPWREAGSNALKTLVSKIGAGAGDYTKSPGYDFRLSEGNKALERSAAAKGNVLGGGTLKALTRYGQDYATQDYDNFLRRYYESLTPLQSLAGVGQSTASQTAAGGASAANAMANVNKDTANQISNNQLLAGQAKAAGTINMTNAVGGSMGSGVNNALLAYRQWQNPGYQQYPSDPGYAIAPTGETGYGGSMGGY